MESYCKLPKSLSFEGDLSENWRVFKQNFDIFLEALESEEKKSQVKVALLLNFVGEEGVDVYNTFDLDDAGKNDIGKVVQAFEKYCAPKKNVLAESANFFNRSQADGETFDSFLTSLETLSEKCEYGDMRDRMIRERFVSGIRDKVLRERLLKTGDLDLLEICRATEASEAAAKASDAKVVGIVDARGIKEKKDVEQPRKEQNLECRKESRVEDTNKQGKVSGGEIGSTEKEANKARSEATFRYTVENFSKMNYKDIRWSPPCYVRNLPWKIKVMPCLNERQRRFLGFWLQCHGERRSNSWSCYASAELRVLTDREEWMPYTKRFEHFFHNEGISRGFSYFINWQDVLPVQNGYIKNDSITLEVHLVA